MKKILIITVSILILAVLLGTSFYFLNKKPTAPPFLEGKIIHSSAVRSEDNFGE